MNNWLKYGLIAMVFAISLSANAQKGERLVQLSGVVVSSDSLQEMPYAAVYNKTVRRGTIADIYGFFSMVFNAGHYGFGHIADRYGLKTCICPGQWDKRRDFGQRGKGIQEIVFAPEYHRRSENGPCKVNDDGTMNKINTYSSLLREVGPV